MPTITIDLPDNLNVPANWDARAFFSTKLYEAGFLSSDQVTQTADVQAAACVEPAEETKRESLTMRIYRWTFILLFMSVCWFGMLAVHELGHVLAAWSSGATVERVVLLPISRTDTSNVESPLFVYGAGAVIGVALPVLIWLTVCGFRWKMVYLFRFFAGFCLVANGAYIGSDFSVIGPTDAGLLIEHGANRLALILFGMLCVSVGLFLWHEQSRFFFPKSC